MKKILLLSISVIFAVSSTTAVHAEEDIIPQPGVTAIGGLSTMTAYISHLALGRVSKADIKGREDAISAAQDAGGIMGGLDVVVKQLKNCRKNMPVGEQKDMDVIIQSNELVLKQAKALLELIKAKTTGAGEEAAQEKYDAARKECAENISKYGFPMKMLQ